MKKRVFIVYGWDGNPSSNWFPWLKKELETKGFEVFIPQLPDSGNPRIYKWVPKLSQAVGVPNNQTYFIGHSMGCQTIARYLETLSENVRVGGVVFVAGFFKRLTGLEDEPSISETADHWLKTPIDLQKVKSHLNESVALFSDNDPYVPLDNQDDFEDKLESKIIIEHKMGHFNESYGITKFPIVLKSILEITKQ
ncbi:MAG: alpha/beta hydrolase [Candidatus Levybacteria bacterium]|nr:alpha/beta hydrolase [Candidatus Levybacteria bacterium]